jgi:dephospho-CoA kinase
MPIIGITGGIASGKSRFCRQLLSRMDADLFDADACAHELLEHDIEVREQVIREVHPRAWGIDGRMDRRLLRETIYHAPEKKRLLEGILHPRIRQRWTDQAQAVSAGGRRLLVDIPLLFETKSESLFDRIVTIACSRATQILRLTGERRLSGSLAGQIIASQMPLEVKMAQSHQVVWNDGSSQALDAQAEIFSRNIHDQYG